ncbi:19157_t:CDS:2 [Gigaspora rosea]|nr:19157_t:CDS:2 [Gigaspora rosea]
MFQPSMKFDAPAYCSASPYISSQKTKSSTPQTTSNLPSCTLAPITSLLTSITSSTTNDITNNGSTIFSIVSCQSSASSGGKNKRGRKPLPTMPSDKRHFRNLFNQRSFRERKKIQLKDLESRAEKFEILYNESQNEIKSLKERVADGRDNIYMIEDNNNHPNDYKHKENVSYAIPTGSEQYSGYSSASGNCNIISSFTRNNTSAFMFNDGRQRQRNQQIEENHNSFQDSLQPDSINNPNSIYEPRSPTHSSSSIETIESGESTVTLNGLSNQMSTPTPFYSIFPNEQKGYWIPLPTASNDDESVWQKFQQQDQQRWRLTSTLPPLLQYDVSRGN